MPYKPLDGPRKRPLDKKPYKWGRKSPEVPVILPSEPPPDALLEPLENPDDPQGPPERPLESPGPMDGPLEFAPQPKYPQPRPSHTGYRRQRTAREVIRAMLDDPMYLDTVEKRMREGKLPPQIEALFWQLVHGRPPEAGAADPKPPTPVRIVHEFTNAAEPEPSEGS